MSPDEAKLMRRERRPAERPQELLEAALRVFAARGYRNARLEEVAAAAGVTKGAVYHYFANKEELLLRAVEHFQARAFGRVEELLREAKGSASDRLRLSFRTLFGGVDPEGREALLLLQRVAPEIPEVYRRWLEGGPMKAWALVASLIDEGIASGEFRGDVDSEVAARVIFTGMMVQAMWQRLSPDVPGLALDQQRLVDSSVELLLAGLRPASALRV